MPPTFAMYRVYAAMQAAGILEAPRLAGDDFRVDVDAVLRTANERSKLLFVCSPNNPTGGVVARDELRALLDARHERSLVVVDEAYVEFSGQASLVGDLDRYPNLVVLRTLSKAWGLAGTRCGAVAAAPDVIAILRRMLPPYAFSAPSTASVLAGLDDARGMTVRCREIVAERERLRAALASLDVVERVWPSRANFLLARFADLSATRQALEARGILVRAFDGDTALAGCARITVGTREQNDRLLATLAGAPGQGL